MINRNGKECKKECIYMYTHIYLEKEMTTHSSNLAWRIPWTEEPGRLVDGVEKSQA